MTLNPDRLFPSDPTMRALARRLHAEVKDLPIVSPHGHTDPAWYADNINFPNPAELFIIPDHYVFRMLHSQGISHEALGIPSVDGREVERDPRKIWRLFAENFHLYRGTPCRAWLEHVFVKVFGMTERLCADNADQAYDHIDAQLRTDDFKVRALFERFNIEVISTTDSPLDDLRHHRAVLDSGWRGRVVPAFRPDLVADPEFEGFARNMAELGELTGESVSAWSGYLRALAQRREYFKTLGCTSTDHGYPTARTANLDKSACQALLDKALKGICTPEEAEIFRGQMLTEMVRMSRDDGLVVQIHPGSFRNHNQQLFKGFGRDKGADIPVRTEYVSALKPLLDEFGNDPKLTVILFTLDESVYSRELAPLAGHYPLLKLGPAWWFHDSPEGMRRHRLALVETAGFSNTVGFNDDTRAFLSIPARHDVARRVDCAFLAELVATHRLDEDEAVQVAKDLAYTLAKQSYQL
ncbi:MAG: glucuronate isomerase [Desulfovibrio sp.]|nr:MAG: glucuronate isomerase [Desulfovibrio sp.]